MIMEIVKFYVPADMTREDILASAKTTVPRWQSFDDLVRKHYFNGEDGLCGGVYIWKNRAAAEIGHDAEWQKGVEERTGRLPEITYYDLMMVLDNEAGTIADYPLDVPSPIAAE